MGTYPSELVCTRQTADGRRVVIRPIRQDDGPREHEFLDHLSGDTRRRRFMRYAFPQNDALVHFFTHVDYDRHMAFVCEASLEGEPHLIGDARYMANPDGRSWASSARSASRCRRCPRSRAWSGW